MRIISGTARGRKLILPPRDITRPLMDRAKEGLFNSLTSLGLIEDAKVLDLYAGAGSFGIECLSRGAAQVTFVEQNAEVAQALRDNLDNVELAANAVVKTQSVNKFLANGGSSSSETKADLVFCDPPYALDPWPELFQTIDAEYLVGHAESEIEVPDTWEVLKRKKYGRAHIVITRRQS